MDQANIKTNSFKWPTVFAWNRPVNRLNFIIHTLLILAVLFPCSVIVDLTQTNPADVPYWIGIAAFSGIFGAILFAQAATSRRLVDLGKSRWWMLAQIVPFLNIYLAAILLFGRGRSYRKARL